MCVCVRACVCVLSITMVRLAFLIYSVSICCAWVLPNTVRLSRMSFRINWGGSGRLKVREACDRKLQRELRKVWWIASSDLSAVKLHYGNIGASSGQGKSLCGIKRLISLVLLHRFWYFFKYCPSWVRQCYRTAMLNHRSTLTPNGSSVAARRPAV